MTAHDLVAKVKNLPPVSQAALKLVNLLDQPAVSNSEVVNVLKYDNVLTAKLLRACNSPYFGLTESISSVDQAVLILGHQQILHIVLTLAFGSAMVVPLPGYGGETKELWRHSLISATAAEVVVNDLPGLNMEMSVAFTAGLLHDIGKLVLGQALTPELQAAVHRLAEDGCISRVEAEKEIFGTDHGEVGAALLQSWNLPEEIVEAVANHHQPVLTPRPRLSVVTHVSNSITHLVGSLPGRDAFSSRVNDDVVKTLELNREKLELMKTSVREFFDRVDLLMGMA